MTPADIAARLRNMADGIASAPDEARAAYPLSAQSRLDLIEDGIEAWCHELRELAEQVERVPQAPACLHCRDTGSITRIHRDGETRTVMCTHCKAASDVTTEETLTDEQIREEMELLQTEIDVWSGDDRRHYSDCISALISSSSDVVRRMCRERIASAINARKATS